MPENKMKKCPFCAEEILAEAIKCRYCHEFLDKRTSTNGKWYFKTHILVVAFLSVGPFALPLLWFNPRFSLVAKIITSVIVLLITYYATIFLKNSINTLLDIYSEAFKQLQV